MATTSPSRLALIGIGHIAESQLEALAETECWQLIAASDIRPERQELLSAGISFFADPREMLRRVNVDLVLVATPNATHYDLARLVLEERRNLLIEKPCCASDEELSSLVELARQSGVRFSVALHASFARDLLWFTANRKRLALGPLTSFHCRFFDPYIEHDALTPTANSLGGSWFDSGINALSVIGRVVDADRLHVRAAQLYCSNVGGCADSDARVELEDLGDDASCLGIIETSWTKGLNSKTTVLQFAHSRTEITLNHSSEEVSIRLGGKLVERVILRTNRPRLVNHYVSLLEDAYVMTTENRSNLDFALPLHRLLFAAHTVAS